LPIISLPGRLLFYIIGIKLNKQDSGCTKSIFRRRGERLAKKDKV
jgi:hypothetical protein